MEPAAADNSGGDRPLAADNPKVIVVGIGASAGGLAALKTFFKNVPDNSGLAWVVVVHLSPQHESHLAALLQPHVHMPVLQVSATTALEPNSVYVIPPNANLSAIDSHLRLSDLEQSRNARAPIDHFFQTLAETHNGNAIGIVLTGTGSDGTVGLKEIKLRGGLTVVQEPTEAEYDSMPQSAIATGVVDLILPVASIPAAVTKFANTQPRLPASITEEVVDASLRSVLQKIFAQIRARTGRDFSQYKRSTVMRRIRRRMQVRFIEEIDRYAEFLRQSQDEVRALSDDLLISVTSFFRDTDVFKRLQEDILPRLFERKGPGDELRVWCAGCATGEEAYSIAMLLLEGSESREGAAPKIQLFATDLHERSLAIARDGFYTGDITAAISPGRLGRFFESEAAGNRIRKEVRNKIVFARHNLLSDPPFSRLDLIVCRNLLIYLQREVHRDVFRLFHYALRPGGYLVLGTAETVDDADRFQTIDKKLAIYTRGSGPAMELRPVMLSASGDVPPDKVAASIDTVESPQLDAMHAEMSRQYLPPSILVAPDGELAHIAGEAGRYLEHPSGPATTSAAKLVREELAVELRTALEAARRGNRVVRSRPVELQLAGETHAIVLNVRPAVDATNDGYCLVIFEEQDAAEAPEAAEESRRWKDPDAAALASELVITRHRLLRLYKDFETTQEESKASNEELQSANEELRSTMEELETSKEELESINEELQSVNQENKHRMEELTQMSGDLQHLLVSTDIATLFLDREFRILRFTPKVADLFNVRQTDCGRPMFDLTHRLRYPELKADSEAVLARLSLIEREVRDADGHWFLVRLLPYRSSEDRIEGIVLAFIDITRSKKAEDENAQLAAALERRVTERTRQVHELTTSLLRAEQRERRRLSETLHDELQQLLYAVQLKLHLVRDETAAGRPVESGQQLQQAVTLLAQSTRLTRQLSVNLNPPILKNEGIKAIFGWLQGQMQELHSLNVEIDAEHEILVEDADVRVVLFQIVRELLFNIAKHSGISSAIVSLKEADGELRVGISDHGRGFDVASAMKQDGRRGSIGLRHVSERVKLLGGQIQIESQPGQGTDIRLQLPKSAKLGP